MRVVASRAAVVAALLLTVAGAVRPAGADGPPAPAGAAAPLVTFSGGDGTEVQLDTLTADAKVFAESDAKATGLPPEVIGLTFARRPVVHRRNARLDVSVQGSAGSTVYLLITDGSTGTSARDGATDAGWEQVGTCKLAGGAGNGGSNVYK